MTIQQAGIGEGERIAQAFVAARRDAKPLPAYPGRRPENPDQAYAIQARAIELQGEGIGGWKVGRINPPLDAHYGTNRLAGPIFTDKVVAEAPGLEMPVFAEGFAAAEAEFLLRIGTTPDRTRRYSREEAAALIDAVHVGIEVASSPYPRINADGPMVTISDFGNNYGLVIGDAVPGWQSGGFIDWDIELLIDGEVAGRAQANAMLDGPFGAAAFLFNLAGERGIAVEAGQWISSGAVTGVHVVRPGQRVVARFGDALKLACSIGRAG